MTQKDKQLLLKDLCARLPYGVKILFQEQVCVIDTIAQDFSLLLKGEDGYVPNIEEGLFVDIKGCKPYLRPMSSITKEEKEEIKPLFSEFTDEFGKRVLVVRQNKMALYQDWLNAHHFDYRGLIPMSLAIEVTKENNPYKE